jgi:hypothetical protein
MKRTIKALALLLALTRLAVRCTPPPLAGNADPRAHTGAG